jgi:hypothetical protein
VVEHHVKDHLRGGGANGRCLSNKTTTDIFYICVSAGGKGIGNAV